MKKNTSLSSSFDNTKSYFGVKLSILTHFLLCYKALKISIQATSVSNSTVCNTFAGYCQALHLAATLVSSSLDFYTGQFIVKLLRVQY